VDGFDRVETQNPLVGNQLKPLRRLFRNPYNVGRDDDAAEIHGGTHQAGSWLPSGAHREVQPDERQTYARKNVQDHPGAAHPVRHPGLLDCIERKAN
jgi:hypothetical protein